MEITDVKIRRTFATAPLRAVASVTFENAFAVHDIKVIETGDRLFIVMPSRRQKDGSFRDVAHPICTAFRQQLESAVLSAYHAARAESDGETPAFQLSERRFVM